MSKYLTQRKKGFQAWRSHLEEKQWRQIFPDPVQAMVLFFYMPLSLYEKQSLYLVEPRAQHTPSGHNATSNPSDKAILQGCCLSPVGPALAWKSFGKMFRQCKDNEIKDNVQLLHFTQGQREPKTRLIPRNCLQSKADGFLCNKVTKPKTQNKKSESSDSQNQHLPNFVLIRQN